MLRPLEQFCTSMWAIWACSWGWGFTLQSSSFNDKYRHVEYCPTNHGPTNLTNLATPIFCAENHSVKVEHVLFHHTFHGVRRGIYNLGSLVRRLPMTTRTLLPAVLKPKVLRSVPRYLRKLRLQKKKYHDKQSKSLRSRKKVSRQKRVPRDCLALVQSGS